MRSQKKRIISLLLGSDPGLVRHLFDPPNSLRLRASPEIIFSDVWELSDESRILVLAALDLWGDGYGNVFLWELLNGLSWQNLNRLIAALEYWRNLKAFEIQPLQELNT